MESEKKYESLLANIPDVLWTADRDGRVTYVSPGIEDLRGWSPKEICRRSRALWFGKIHPHDVERVKEAYERLFSRNEKYDVEYRIRKKDGHLIWVRDKAAFTYEKEGVQYADGVLSDISERKEAELSLSERYRELIATNQISKIVLNADSLDDAFEDIVEEISKATDFPIIAIELYDEARLKMVFKGLKGIPLPPGTKTLEIPVDETLSGVVARTGQPLIEIQPSDAPNDEASILNQLGVHTFVCVPMGARQRIIGALSLGHSKTIQADEEFLRWAQSLANYVASMIERRQAEEGLRESESRTRAIVTTAVDAIITTDDRGIVQAFNPAAERMFDYAKEEVLGNNVSMLMPEPYSSQHDGYIKRYRSTGEKRVIGIGREVVGRRKDGTTFPMELSLADVELPDRRLFTAIIRNVTERKQAEEALQESEAKYRSLMDDVLDNSGMGIFILDSDFRVVWINQILERYFGLQEEEILGKDQRQLVGSRIKRIFEEPETFAAKTLATYQNNTYVERFECHVLPDKEREERWLEHWSQPIHTGLYAGGRIERYTDVTERKRPR
jgi:PAS domain S-box-containing protein